MYFFKAHVVFNRSVEIAEVREIFADVEGVILKISSVIRFRALNVRILASMADQVVKHLNLKRINNHELFL